MSYNRYIYQIGDKVFHDHHPEIVGEIIKLLTCEEGDPVDQLDNNNPYYNVKWYDNNTEWIGFEHQSVLLPEYVNLQPIKFIQHCFQHNKDVWDDIVSKISKSHKC